MMPGPGPNGGTTRVDASDVKLDRQALIVRCMPQARAMAARYRGRGLSPEDLQGEAYAALVEAAGKFDVDLHLEQGFWPYARKWIHGRIVAALKRARIVPLDRSDTAVEEFGLASLPADQPALLLVVEEMLSQCTELGRKALVGFAVEGLTWLQLSRRLGVPVRRVQQEHDRAAQVVAAEFRRRGYTADQWSRMIA